MEIFTRPKLYTILAAIWWKRSYFVENVSSRSPGWVNFHPGYRDLGRNNRDLGNRASPAPPMNTPIFLQRKEWRGEIEHTRPCLTECPNTSRLVRHKHIFLLLMSRQKPGQEPMQSYVVAFEQALLWVTGAISRSRLRHARTWETNPKQTQRQLCCSVKNETRLIKVFNVNILVSI